MQGSALDSSALSDEVVDEPIDSCRAAVEGDPDFDDIDNMRIRGNLFFKLDRDSKEFEEYNFNFHRRKKSSKQKDDPKESQRKGNELKDSKRDNPSCELPSRSKTSVRACIIHRVTSKVVVVAHSISKDMKFDLGSTRNAAACAGVGEILAQRALDDDIHDVIYTPRKGERLEVTAAHLPGLSECDNPISGTTRTAMGTRLPPHHHSAFLRSDRPSNAFSSTEGQFLCGLFFLL
ncbi:hypothetical protein FF1_022193 [Malus domestica]